MEHRNTQEKRDWCEVAQPMRKIGAPARHEGVGNALRRAYISQHYNLPSDMADLLAKLA